MPRPRDRLIELDALRGIAALMVVLFHTLLILRSSGSLTYRVLDASPLHPIFAGRPPVIFFFVLSGAVLTRSLMREPGSRFSLFAGRRIIRLWLPAVAALTLSATLYTLVADKSWAGFPLYGGWSRPTGPIDFVRQALLIGGDEDFVLDTSLWSLVHELRLSLLLPLIVARPFFRGNQGSINLLLCCLIWFGTSVSGHTAIENNIMLGPSVATSFVATAYFALPFAAGAALSLGGWDRWQPSTTQRKIAFAAAILLLCSDNDWAAVAASVLLILLSRHDGLYQDFLRLPVLQWLGRVSFSLYLVHMPVQLAIQHGLHTVLSEFWMEPLTIVASLLAAWAMYHLVERPSQHLSRLIGPMRPARAPGNAPGDTRTPA